jgi:fucose permease
LAIEGLGKFTKTGSALLIVGIVGGAVLPKVWATLGALKSVGFQQAFWIMIPCYLFIFYFGTIGHRIGKDKKVYSPVPVEV